jgi:hypothetical protein
MNGITKKLATVTAGAAIALSGIGMLGQAAPAGATTNASAKVCAYTAGHGTPVKNATLTSYYYSSTGWKKFATGTTSSSGCGWVPVPTGWYDTVEVYKAPATDSGNYTAGQFCRSIGYVLYDTGVTNYRLVPAGTGGINFGTVSTGLGRINCY